MAKPAVDLSRAPVPIEPPLRYDAISILLHWLTAGLVLLLWSSAQVIDFFPTGSPRITARSVHISLGVLLGLVQLGRLGWRITFGKHLPLAFQGLVKIAPGNA